MIRRAFSSVVLFVLVATARGAYAGDAALAESLFREGRALMEQGNYAAACPKLAESLAQEPATGTLLALALCQEQTGRTASAWASYAEVVSRAKRDGRADREQAAREHLQALEPKLSRLTVEVDASTASVPGVVVKRDGLPLGTGAWGAASPVDPGEHRVEVTAPGKRPWMLHVTVGALSDSQTVKVPGLDDDPAAQARPPESGPVAAEGTATVAAVPHGPPLRTIGLGVGAAGIVSLGVSGFFALRAKSLNDDSKSDGHCDARNGCDGPGLAKRDSAVTASTVATVALVAGGVLTAAGVTLFVVGAPKDAKADGARVEALPVVSPAGAAMFVRGRF